jgi:hypothetical protein
MIYGIPVKSHPKSQHEINMATLEDEEMNTSKTKEVRKNILDSLIITPDSRFK